MTFFLGMNYKFSLYIFQLFPKSPPILGKFDLKHQFTSIFTKIFPIYLQDFQIFPLSKPSEMLWPFFLERILINFPHFHQKWINFSSPPATTSSKIRHPCFKSGKYSTRQVVSRTYTQTLIQSSWRQA